MGGLVSRLRRLLGIITEMRVLLQGLDAAGKTTVLYKLRLGGVVTTIPTIGFNVETIEYNRVQVTLWDVGGRDKMRPLMRHYYPNTNALIWVIDSTDTRRMGGEPNGTYDEQETARTHMHQQLCDEELLGLPLLVFANKQDLPNALSTEEVARRLGLRELRGRAWLIQGCCAISGDGLYEGLEWLTQAVKTNPFRLGKPAHGEVVRPMTVVSGTSVAPSTSSIRWDQPPTAATATVTPIKVDQPTQSHSTLSSETVVDHSTTEASLSMARRPTFP